MTSHFRPLVNANNVNRLSSEFKFNINDFIFKLFIYDNNNSCSCFTEGTLFEHKVTTKSRFSAFSLNDSTGNCNVEENNVLIGIFNVSWGIKPQSCCH